MIELVNLRKSYPTKQGPRHVVFDNVNAVIPEGKSVGILGRNGAGKTTLLRILGGIDFPDSGEVKTNKLISWPVGLRGGFHAKLTGREVATFVCRMYCQDESEIEEKVEWVKAFSEIEESFETYTGGYSSGMKARMGFALSMAFDFDYYLIDEITAVGDRFFKKKSREALKKKREHACVLMVSHGLESLKNYCDIGMLVEAGNVTIYESIEEAISVYEKL